MTIKIEQGGFYRDARGRLWGPMERDKDAGSRYDQWRVPTHGPDVAWSDEGVFTSRRSDYDLAERIYVSTTPPPAPVKIDGAALTRAAKALQTIQAIRDGTPVTLGGSSETGARVALADYYKDELRALGITIE